MLTTSVAGGLDAGRPPRPGGLDGGGFGKGGLADGGTGWGDGGGNDLVRGDGVGDDLRGRGPRWGTDFGRGPS